MNVRTPPTSVSHTILKLLCLSLLALGVSRAARAQSSPYTPSIYTTNTLFIEAEDADFTGGKFVTTTNIGMNGPYPGGSYANLGTVQDYNIDWLVQSSSAPNGQA